MTSSCKTTPRRALAACLVLVICLLVAMLAGIPRATAQIEPREQASRGELQADFDAAKAKWDGLGNLTESYWLDWYEWCSSPGPCQFGIGAGGATIEADTVMSVGPDRIKPTSFPTVNDLFEAIQAEIIAEKYVPGGYHLLVKYDEEYGYPRNFEIDPWPAVLDEPGTVQTRIHGLEFRTPTGGVMVAVTCLAGNGRVDINIVNIGTEAVAFRIELESVSPRQHTVAVDDWWRMPFTGRSDGLHDLVVLRDGVVVHDSPITVECDAEIPVLSRDAVQVMSTCRDGNGYVIFQFVNASPDPVSYVIEFEGVKNRSTTAAAWGGAVRATSGRPDGDYRVKIRPSAGPGKTLKVGVDCD